MTVAVLPVPADLAGDVEVLPERRPVYSSAFWLAYVANTAVVTANALTYRFAELVDFFGGREKTAGLIVGIATAAALLARVFLGQALDRYGARRLWILSSLLFIAGGAMLTLADSLAWTLYVARGLFAIGLAGMFTCSTVHIQNLVPPYRRTEVIGSLGSSGFLGMILGSLLGDAIFHGVDGRLKFMILFGLSTLLGLAYLGLVLFVTRHDHHERPAFTPPLHHLVFRYWPGNVMLVAVAIGMMVAVTTVFLTRFATHRHLSGLGPFFVAYASSAFTFRIVTRGWSRSFGRHRMILLGLAGHTLALLLLPFVNTEWQFALPALFGGFGHALLFPAVVSLGSEAFPPEYRGTGTTLVMGFFDVGTFVSAPILGGLIDTFDGTGFTPMFLTAAATVVAVAAIYLTTSARRPDTDLTTNFASEASARNPLASEVPATEDFARERPASESSARGFFAAGSSARQELGCQDSAPQISARDRSSRESIVPEPSAPASFAPEASAPQKSAREGFAPEGSVTQPSARPAFASGTSAREGSIADRRVSAAHPATRCR